MKNQKITILTMSICLAVLLAVGMLLFVGRGRDPAPGTGGGVQTPGAETEAPPIQPEEPETEAPSVQPEQPETEVPPAQPEEPEAEASPAQPESQPPAAGDGLFVFESLPVSADIVLTQGEEVREALGLQGREELEQLTRELEHLAPARAEGVSQLRGSWMADLTLTLEDGSQRSYQFSGNDSGGVQRTLMAAAQGGEFQGYRTHREVTPLRRTLEGMVREANQQEEPFLIGDALAESRLVVYDNSSRLLVSAGERAGEIAKALARLEVLQLEEGPPVGSPLDGASEMRLLRWDSDYGADGSTAYVYTLYPDGVLVSGGSFYRCTPETVRELAEAMGQVYRQGKATPSWLGIMTLEKYNSMVVYSAAAGSRRHVGLLFEDSVTLFQALKELHVERDSLETIRQVPEEGEYYLELEFNTGVTYRIGIQDGYLYLDSSDMREGLRYRLVEDAEFARFETVVEFWIPCQDSEGRVNPLTAKPVIYLYPARQQEIAVRLDFDGVLTYTYPQYPKAGWRVLAQPDGTLTNLEDGSTHYYLFWEGVADEEWPIRQGSVVAGRDTQEFLVQALSGMGLTPREYNDFIVYWLPRMQENPYNLISFSGPEYGETARLTVTPEPDSVLRVHMVWRALEEHQADQYAGISPQRFSPFRREGFTLVEWGGTQVG